jgi:hypothetical protein
MVEKFKPTCPPKTQIWGTYIPARQEQWKTYYTQQEAIDSLLWTQSIPYPSDPKVPLWEEHYDYRAIDCSNSLWQYNGEWVEIPIKRFRKKDQSILDSAIDCTRKGST